MSLNQLKREQNSVAVLGVNKQEPIVEQSTYKSDLIKALNYYNVVLDEKDIYRNALQFVQKYHPTFKSTVDKAKDYELRQIGMLGRLVIRQQYVSPEHLLLIANQLLTLQRKYIKTQDNTSVIRESVQDRIKETVIKHGAEIDQMIDGFITNKSSTFDMKQYLQVNEVSGIVSKKIAELYQPLWLEISSNDPEIIEGYSTFTRIQLRRYASFVKNIIDCCNQHGVSAVVRKPRVVRPKSPVVITAKVQYLKEFPELQLKSIDVTKLVNAREVWLYNVQYRKLTVLRGADEGSLLITGTTISNHDLNTSGTKTIRNPKIFFNGSLGKRALNTAYKNINGKVSLPKTRLNDQTIILAVF